LRHGHSRFAIRRKPATCIGGRHRAYLPFNIGNSLRALMSISSAALLHCREIDTSKNARNMPGVAAELVRTVCGQRGAAGVRKNIQEINMEIRYGNAGGGL
jgi:hypothetical protein